MLTGIIVEFLGRKFRYKGTKYIVSKEIVKGSTPFFLLTEFDAPEKTIKIPFTKAGLIPGLRDVMIVYNNESETIKMGGVWEGQTVSSNFTLDQFMESFWE